MLETAILFGSAIFGLFYFFAKKAPPPLPDLQAVPLVAPAPRVGPLDDAQISADIGATPSTGGGAPFPEDSATTFFHNIGVNIPGASPTQPFSPPQLGPVPSTFRVQNNNNPDGILQ